MVRKRLISTLVGVGLAGALVGCVGTRTEDFIASSFTTRAAVAAEAARVVRVVDADTYIMLSGTSTYRLRLLGVDAPEHDQAFGPQAADSVARLPRRWPRPAGKPTPTPSCSRRAPLWARGRGADSDELPA